VIIAGKDAFAICTEFGKSNAYVEKSKKYFEKLRKVGAVSPPPLVCFSLPASMRAVETWLESRDDEEIITDASRLDKEPLRFENEKGFETDTLMDAPAPSNAVDLPLTLLVKVLYAMADVGLTGFSAIIGFYLNAFLLEVASIPPEAVAFILLGAKVRDFFFLFFFFLLLLL
jgi:hypothetical protein